MCLAPWSSAWHVLDARHDGEGRVDNDSAGRVHIPSWAVGVVCQRSAVCYPFASYGSCCIFLILAPRAEMSRHPCDSDSKTGNPGGRVQMRSWQQSGRSAWRSFRGRLRAVLVCLLAWVSTLAPCCLLGLKFESLALFHEPAHGCAPRDLVAGVSRAHYQNKSLSGAKKSRHANAPGRMQAVSLFGD